MTRRAYFLTRAVLAVVVMGIAGCASPSYEGYKYRPYVIRGVRYEPMHPREAVGFVEEGVASWYNAGNLLFPKKTAIGETYRPWHMSGAHKTVPLPARVRVTNLENGRSVVIRVNDRGPFIPGRVIDVSPRVAEKLGFKEKGLARVRVEVLSVGDGRYRIR